MRSRRLWAAAVLLTGVAFGSPGIAHLFAQMRSGVVMGVSSPPAARPDGTGTLRGRVVEGGNGQPLRGATIWASWRAAEGEGQAQFSTRTDGLGGFTIERLPDGVYFVHVQRQGFYDGPGTNQSPRQVTLRGGGTIDLGDVRLLTGGVLTGRVLDHHGEPVVGGRVTALGRLPGQEVLMPLGGTAVTDDRGVYRAHGLMPATYTVRVVPPGPSGRGAVRLQGNEPESLPAFATSTSELSAAEFVDVRAGEAAILDVRLGAGRLSRVVGRVVVPGEAATSTQLSVSLHLIDPGVQFAMASARPQPDGLFELLDVAPGRYRVVAEELMGVTPQGMNRRRAGWAEMAVAGEPVVEVAVPIGFGAVVRGRVEVEGGDVTTLHDRPLEVVTSSVAARHFLQSGSMASSTISDLTFTLRDVLGHQQLHVQGLPPDWWLKSVLIDGEDVFEGREFPVTGTVDGVVLLVSSRPSGVRGASREARTP
ncbi:hypothetical protein TBR22_A18930 [Luteitalea sp. TBR-22]|uniref:carboxypeptidase-like regulatory domain-containing protein n=1 Tax=Luteitalea sp. TBR-22 TaxID=2802971 RepID=UPI001AF9564F|nr:carboxypeptidase-like regulatory domain-containing protein [Luteitalea sp. TBR-22]BCS32675.1 hypothetical protein TBR22_A18930 [Luteitalea sp. TBR-22]